MKYSEQSRRMGALCLLGAGLACAQQLQSNAPVQTVPRLISFSGVVNDATGKPRIGELAITFSLYDQQDSQTPLWQETRNVTTDQQGRYAAQLGSTLPAGVPLDLFTSGKALWLGVQTLGDGAPEQTRVLLVSVPYALKAADADTLGGKPASAYVTQEAVSAMAAGSAAARAVTAIARNSSGFTFPISPATSGTGTQNYIPLWIDNAGTLGNSLLYQSGGNIGMGSGFLGAGTTAPSSRLTVIDSVTTADGATRAASQVIGTVTLSTASSSQLIRGALFRAQVTQNDTVNPLNYVQGFLGIAEVIGGTGLVQNVAGAQLVGRLNGGGGTITNSYGAYVIGALKPSGSGTVTNGYGVYVENLTGTANTPFAFYQAGTGNYNYFAGKVGIGTTTPAAQLEVNGTAKFDGAVTFAGGGALTGATTGGGLAVTGSTVGLLTSCSSGQVLSWSGSAWACATVSGGGGGGTITGVTAGTDLTGGGTSGTVTLNVDTTKVPQLATANTFTDSTAGATAMSVTATDTTAANTGVSGTADGPNGTGVIGEADNGANAAGVWGISSSGLAGEFSGDVSVTGNISKSGGSFKIDDPLDPANEYLYHSFVESPDMKNIYDGVATLDSTGSAVVQLPGWFSALNRDFRYQLTCIGGFAPVYISAEVNNNQFSIAGGKPGMRVSWQVTGIRQDAWANAHRIPVEQAKPANERGYYLHPELEGAPPEKNIIFAEHPALAKNAAAAK